jgi:hypothetical protein
VRDADQNHMQIGKRCFFLRQCVHENFSDRRKLCISTNEGQLSRFCATVALCRADQKSFFSDPSDRLKMTQKKWGSIAIHSAGPTHETTYKGNYEGFATSVERQRKNASTGLSPRHAQAIPTSCGQLKKTRSRPRACTLRSGSDRSTTTRATFMRLYAALAALAIVRRDDRDCRRSRSSTRTTTIVIDRDEFFAPADRNHRSPRLHRQSRRALRIGSPPQIRCVSSCDIARCLNWVHSLAEARVHPQTRIPRRSRSVPSKPVWCARVTRDHPRSCADDVLNMRKGRSTEFTLRRNPAPEPDILVPRHTDFDGH